MKVPVLVAAVLLGFGVAFYAQAASPDYRNLLVFLAPFASLQLVIAVAYFFRVKGWSRWVVLASVVVSAGSFAELGLRVMS